MKESWNKYWLAFHKYWRKKSLKLIHFRTH